MYLAFAITAAIFFFSFYLCTVAPLKLRPIFQLPCYRKFYRPGFVDIHTKVNKVLNIKFYFPPFLPFFLFLYFTFLCQRPFTFYTFAEYVVNTIPGRKSDFRGKSASTIQIDCLVLDVN